MADTFTLAGSWSANPAIGAPSGIAYFCTPISEALQLTRKDYDTIVLAADAPVAVDFGGGVTSAHVVIIKATGGKVKVALTSADGTLQAIPVDSMLILISRTVPFTALELTRLAGTATQVEVFLGQVS